jgi:parallel beta-helix repeat protein
MKMHHRLTAALIVTACLACHIPYAWAETVHVGKGRTVSSLADVKWASLKPGDKVIVGPMISDSVVVVTAQGSAANPIIVRSAKGAQPIVENSIVVQGSRHIVFDGLTVRNAKHSGFILRRGAEDITIRNSVVYDSGLGIWIGDGAKDDHRLLNNVLFRNKTHGIAIDVINSRKGHETLISGNHVFRNGIHGMEINGNRYIVEHNVVYENGQSMSGISGIHTYARSPDQNAGDYNIIRYNISFGNIDREGQDGNGIQLDQWCDHNQVYYNVAFGNDGAGINIFDGADNTVFNNTLYDNMQDPGGTHAYKAELVVASDFTKNIDHTVNNRIFNNIIYATNKKAVAMLVDKLSVDNNLTISNNLLYHLRKGANLWSWAAKKGNGINAWNNLVGVENFHTDPLFFNPFLPERDGLRLRRISPARGKGMTMDSPVDLLNHSVGTNPDLGAYTYAPGAN